MDELYLVLPIEHRFLEVLWLVWSFSLLCAHNFEQSLTERKCLVKISELTT